MSSLSGSTHRLPKHSRDLPFWVPVVCLLFVCLLACFSFSSPPRVLFTFEHDKFAHIATLEFDSKTSSCGGLGTRFAVIFPFEFQYLIEMLGIPGLHWCSVLANVIIFIITFWSSAKFRPVAKAVCRRSAGCCTSFTQDSNSIIRLMCPSSYYLKFHLRLFGVGIAFGKRMESRYLTASRCTVGGT